MHVRPWPRFALGSLTYLSDSLALVLAGTVADGAGLLWLVAVTGAAIQRYTPPRLQGRATAAWTMAVITPQTVSIAAGTAVISLSQLPGAAAGGHRRGRRVRRGHPGPAS